MVDDTVSAYLLKEQPQADLPAPADAAIALLDAWIKWPRRCRLAPFVRLVRTITDQRAGILAAIEHGLSNGRVEAINTQIRLLTRRAFGVHNPDTLLALRDAQPRRPLPTATTVKHPLTRPTDTSGDLFWPASKGYGRAGAVLGSGR